MTVTDAAEKVNNSSVIGALGKIAPILVTVMLTIGLFVLGQYLNGQTKIMDTLESRVTLAEQAAVVLGNRVGNIESRIAVVGPSRDQFQRETQAAVKDMTSAISALALDMATTKRDVGYLRDWVEDLKRRNLAGANP